MKESYACIFGGFCLEKCGIDREKTGRYGQKKEMHKGPQITPAENLESQIVVYPLHHVEPLC